jgi:hypothetical protein
MAQFQGFKCDRCDIVVDADDRTKQTVKYDGPEVQGEFTLDLCRECVVVPPDVDLKPLRRRRKGATEPVREQARETVAAPAA